MWLAVRAVDDRDARASCWLGVVLGVTALSRPVFVLFPFALAAVGLVVLPLSRRARGPRRAPLGGDARARSPSRCCRGSPTTTSTLGAFTLSPAGGVGRGIWEGSWQATWSGRLQNELTHLADDIDDRADARRARRGGRRTRAARRRSRCSSTCISGTTSAASGREPIDPLERAPRPRRGRPRISARRRSTNIRRAIAGASGEAARARRVRPVGRRHPVSLQRHQPDCRRS